MERATLKLKYPSGRIAEAIALAITPDNEKAPPGLRIETQIENSSLIASVYCERGLDSLTATLDDLLACIQAAERALSATQHAQKASQL